MTIHTLIKNYKSSAMKIILTIKGEAQEAMEKMMSDDMQTSKSSFIAFLVAREWQRRNAKVGRPKKEEADELPDENAPRKLKNPYPELVPRADRDKLVNAYDIAMLEAKREHQQND